MPLPLPPRLRPISETGVLRAGVVQLMAGLTLALTPAFGVAMALAGAPPVFLILLGLTVALMIGVLTALRLDRQLIARVVFLLGSTAILATGSVLMGPESHLQYFLVPGAGMPFLLIEPDRRSLRHALSALSLPTFAVVQLSQLKLGALTELPASTLHMLGLGNDLAMVLTAFVMFAVFTCAADDQIARIQDQRSELESRSHELEAVNEELDAFARVVSHDLKTPLGSLLGVVELLELDRDQLSPGHRELLRTLRTTASGMNDLIHALLAHARAGQRTPTEAVDLDSLVRSLLEQTPTAGLTVHHTPVQRCVTTHALPLRQVLANLLSNAAKYSRPGGRIWIRLRVEGPTLHLEVEDDGVGIPPDRHDQVFRLFGTAHGEARHDSTGVGMATARKLVEVEGGTIHFRSTPGEGTLFQVCWPLATPGEVDCSAEETHRAA